MIEVEVNGQHIRVYAEKIAGTLWVHYKGRTFTYEESAPSRRAKAQGPGSGQLVAPMPGKIIKVFVNQGERVNQGQVLVILEAMKMEYSLCADKSGVINQLNCEEGEQVQSGQELVMVGDCED